jgi:hypothetical protein
MNIRKVISDIIKEIKERLPLKAEKSIALYSEDSPSGKFICKECKFFIPFEKMTDEQKKKVGKKSGYGMCTIVGDEKSQEISGEKGSCMYYVAGEPATGEKENEYKVSKELSLYQESDEGFGCKRCVRFKGDGKPCTFLKENVKSGGCCTAWLNPKVS